MFSALIILLFVEIFLILLVQSFRQEFQWLITEKDEHPKLDRHGLEKFFKHGYDATLGWVRKPNTQGVEKGSHSQVSYAIDEHGARQNPNNFKEASIAAFGDSYVFCRQVNDGETWAVYLSQMLGTAVPNFGVGNYGADQGLLRYEQSSLPESVKVVILGFVPESICRIQSYWKHYLEFGNTFAFKPRFEWDGTKLTLIPNVMATQEDFARLEEKLETIQKHDGFYKSKFRSMQFRFPYLLSYLRHPERNTRLLFSLIYRWFARNSSQSTAAIENAPFKIIMESNIKEAHRMYSNPIACELLKAILLRFKEQALQRGHVPVVLVMPQLIDLIMAHGKSLPYSRFFEELNQQMTTIDLTQDILKESFDRMYVEDSFGGHFSKEGNEFIARCLSVKLKEYALRPSQV